MMDGNPTYFMPIKGMLLMALGIIGLVVMGYTLIIDDQPENRQQKIEITTGYEAQITIDGDTTKRIYVLQDSLSGIVWVGIPGKNRLRK